MDRHATTRSVVSRGRMPVFLTDSAVGTEEEHNLRHLSPTLAATCRATRRAVPDDQALARLLPVVRRAGVAARVSVARRARRRQDGRPPRCVEHAWELRRLIREREPRSRSADGPTRTPSERAGRFPARLALHAEFYLTQIVSHHECRAGASASSTRPSGRHGASAGDVWRVLLSQREPEDAGDAEPLLPVPIEVWSRNSVPGASAVTSARAR